MIVLSFIVFLCLFVGVGLYSVRKSRKSNKDYLLASRSVKAWMVALSAVSTNNSGYMFIGQIGFTYSFGVSSIWIMVGWLIGDFIMSLIVHQKIHETSDSRDIYSFGGLISNWWGKDYQLVRRMVGLLTVIFLGIYAAAQLKAGGKALTVLFDWDTSTGIYLGAAMVVAYCFAGGIRASIWTDVVQSFVMLGSMALLFFYALSNLGGWSGFWQGIQSVSTEFGSFTPQSPFSQPMLGTLFFVMGWFFAGAGIIGQPHIMIRILTMDHAKNMGSFRQFYYLWFTAFYLLAIGVGLSARLLIPAENTFDPELALPTLSQALLPDVFVGVMLAGIFAATMSTADSQILSCSAALTRDFFKKKSDNYWITKLVTLSITVVSMFIALYAGSNVFYLVLYAWGTLASGFGPILFLYCFSFKLNQKQLITMMVAGMTTSITWKFLGYSSIIFETAPGMAAGFLSFALIRLLFRSRA